ncbi:MAG: family 43 glycosylhydrolase [Bacteroides stercoris]
MSADATQVIGPSRIIFDGHERSRHVRGPKLCQTQRDYYVFLCRRRRGCRLAGGLRSRNIYGPYENRTVLAQGSSPVNGPHQGGWVDTPTGEDWFMHFQDVGAYGRRSTSTTHEVGLTTGL